MSVYRQFRNLCVGLLALFVCGQVQASESIFCEGKKYSVEVLVSLSSGDIFGVTLYSGTRLSTSASATSLGLGKRSIDYPTRKILFSATHPEDKSAAISFSSKGKKGVLYYRGKHAVACNWSAF
jgi:hypothetical protein